MRFFHRFPAAEDPEKLLDPDEQWSTPWGDDDPGRCDKCGGAGRTEHRCLSCHGATRRDCPACEGRIAFVDRCPACEGSGEITRTKRRGVSAFPALEGLYRYMARRDSDLQDSVVVELEGPLSGDLDLDADEGAVLVLPERILATHRMDESLAKRLAGEEPT